MEIISQTWDIQSREGDQPWFTATLGLDTEGEAIRLLQAYRINRPWKTYRIVCVTKTLTNLGEL